MGPGTEARWSFRHPTIGGFAPSVYRHLRPELNQVLPSTGGPCVIDGRGKASTPLSTVWARIVRVFVLGVDPGLSRCGYAVVAPGRRRRGVASAQARALGVIRTSPDHETPQRLAELKHELTALIDDYRPAVIAVERIFFQNNIRTAVGVAQASGLALVLGAERGIIVAQYSPSEVKSVVAGDGRADKSQVQTMVQTLLGLERPPRPADAADAAALALCHLAHDPHLKQAAAQTISSVAAR